MPTLKALKHAVSVPTIGRLRRGVKINIGIAVQGLGHSGQCRALQGVIGHWMVIQYGIVVA